MKKLFVLLVVVALTLVTSAVMAAEVTVGGEIAVRSRNFGNMDMYDNAADGASTQQRDTQTRMKIDVNAKAGDVKGKLQLWNDFETWGDNVITGTTNNNQTTYETQPGSTLLSGTATGAGTERNTISFREAWISFPLPVIPVTITAGHQLLTIGNGWFIRSQHYGSDAWVVSNTTGPNTAAIVNMKIEEGTTNASNDLDLYTVLDVFKINDSMTVGADITMVNDRTDKVTYKDDVLMNFGVNFNGKIGPVALKAELDLQSGEAEGVVAANDLKYQGNQIVVQASVPVGPVTINATIARGSGDDNALDDKEEEFQPALDIDPHYTFLYEYKIPTATGAKNTGFANTTAIGVGATFAATKSLTVGADVWQLMATEDTNVTQTGGAAGAVDDKIGMEIDVKVNWNVADNLKWNWVAGVFMPGDAYKDAAGHGDDMATGVQGILSFAF